MRPLVGWLSHTAVVFLSEILRGRRFASSKREHNRSETYILVLFTKSITQIHGDCKYSVRRPHGTLRSASSLRSLRRTSLFACSSSFTCAPFVLLASISMGLDGNFR